MIPNVVGWYYITVAKLSAFLRGVTSKYDGYMKVLKGPYIKYVRGQAGGFLWG